MESNTQTHTKKPILKSVQNVEVEEAPSSDKKNWFIKLFQNFSSHNNATKASKNHVTNISFDDAHMLTLNEFNKDSIDYQLKNLDHKFGRKVVEYDCKFVKGNFKFKIKITSTPNASTVITVKKRSKHSNTSSNKAFEKFNDDVERVIRNAGRS
ncbi:ADM_collapsed_G0033280.mRNA.1.CDS.1 [Saccharomyces cerevisiae]|nr:ADM_collapsed_G0033280.mRNA.1.CDS.1 [Saccharomyces cerevisiae]